MTHQLSAAARQLGQVEKKNRKPGYHVIEGVRFTMPSTLTSRFGTFPYEYPRHATFHVVHIGSST